MAGMSTPTLKGFPPMKNYLTLMVAAAGALASSIVPAQARDIEYSEAKAIVRYDDLNLSQASGRARLEQRLLNAANRVCGVREARALDDFERAMACRDQAIAKSKIQVAIALDKAGALYAGRASE